MTREPAAWYRRTAAERADPVLSWARSDRAFFAAGACHILAWACVERHPGRELAPVGLRRVGEADVFHVFATDGAALAYDFAGWSSHAELVAVNRRAVAAQRPGTVVEEIALAHELSAFCAVHGHRLPEQFAGDVWARARAYIDDLPVDLGDALASGARYGR